MLVGPGSWSELIVLAFLGCVVWSFIGMAATGVFMEVADQRSLAPATAAGMVVFWPVVVLVLIAYIPVAAVRFVHRRLR